MRFARLITSVALLGLVGAACGGGDGDDGGNGGNGGNGNGDGAVDAAECGLEEFAAAPKPVEITYWHGTTRENFEWLKEATAEFNESQGDVKVNLVQQPSYQETFVKYRAGLDGGDLPDLVQLEETVVQAMIDSESAVPVQACVEADDYALDDFVPRTIEYYSSDGVLQAMPWTVSNPVLFWDRSDFVEAGLDPDDPPETLAEVREYAQKIVDAKAATHGIALRIEPYVFEFLYAKSGGEYVNNGNGREGRATAANLDTDIAREIWTWWNDMVADGLALDTGGKPGNFDHMLSVGTGDAAMAIEASGVLGIVKAVLESGQYPGVEITAAPLPSLEGDGGIPVGDAALWLPKASSPEKRGAAWQFVKFLSTPEQAASLAAAAGFVPVRVSASEQPVLVQRWEAEPVFRVGYDQLLAGPSTNATKGTLVGDYQGVRDAVRDGLTRMLEEGVDPATALAEAQADATEAIEAYNSRVGV